MYMMLHQSTIDLDIGRPTFLEIDLNAIRHNYLQIKQYVGSPVKVMAILKANAYGHGLIPVAAMLQKIGADYLGVAYLEEAVMLRKAEIRLPILVLGGIVGDQIPHFIEHDITLCASSVEKLDQIERHAKLLGKKAIVHLKIDTGMERIGIHYYNALALLEYALACSHTHVEGVFSHLANADQADNSFTEVQHERFRQVIRFYNHKDPKPLFHISNTAGAMCSRSLHYDMVRIGLSLYGISDSYKEQKQLTLKPALSWKTKVVYFKVVKPGHTVSYGGSWTADKMTRMVTLPVGYGDGYMRAMSHKAMVIIRGQSYPVRGVICMDQMMVDIGWNSAYNGDMVTLIGTDGDQCISVLDLAKWANTIPYEILTNINTRVPRYYLPESE